MNMLMVSATFNAASSFVLQRRIDSQLNKLRTQRGASPFETFEVVAATGGAVWALARFRGAEERENRRKWREYEAQETLEREARWLRASIAPKDEWALGELKAYDGSADQKGPLLIAVDGSVYNCHKGRHFYGPGCEYHVFAGRDATRLLAKGLLEEEPPEALGQPLSYVERAALAGWLLTFRAKYECVGKLAGAGGALTAGVEAAAPDFNSPTGPTSI
jgi:membrane-associated progesterone receptor component